MTKHQHNEQLHRDKLQSARRSNALINFLLFGALLTAPTTHISYAQDLDFLTPLSVSSTLDLRSQNFNTPTSIVFVNDYGKEIVIHWVNYTGQLVFYSFLAPGDHYIQQTYLTHPWLVTDQTTGRAIEGFLPIAREAIALVAKPAVSDADKQYCAANKDTSRNLALALSLTATIVAEDPPLAFAIGLASQSFDQLADTEEQCSIDPPDQNYKQIAQPIISLPTHITPTGTAITSAEAAAINDLNNNLATASGVLNAAITSANRALGAAEAGNKQWQTKQTKTAKSYLDQYQRLADKKQSLITNLKNALAAAGLSTSL